MEKPPKLTPTPTPGLHAHGAILASLFARTTTQVGERIDCSLLDSQTATLVNIGSNYLTANQDSTRLGTAHASIVPYQLMPTKDSFIMIGAGNDKQFRKLCDIIGKSELANDDKFQTNHDRVLNRDVLVDILEKRFRQESTQIWLNKFEGSGIPYAPLNTVKQAFEHPQVLARDMVQEVVHPTAGRIKLIGKFSNRVLLISLVTKWFEPR